MATPRTGKPRGAPPKQYRTDPDRHVIGFADAMIMAGQIERTAFNLAMQAFYCNEITPEKKMRRRQPENTVQVSSAGLDRERFFERHYERLLAKSRRTLECEDTTYRTLLATLIRIAFEAPSEPERNARAIGALITLAQMIGERSFAEKVLVPVALSKKISTPDLFPHV